MAGPLSSLVMDFNESHVYNPAWPPHARYHGFLFMNLLVAVGALSIALLWRPKQLNLINETTIVGILNAAIWTSFLLPLVVPEVSPWPDGFQVTMPLNGNIILALVMLFLTAVGLGFRSSTARNHLER
jgi:hypothetical protein